MYIEEIKLHNFRNYEEQKIELIEKLVDSILKEKDTLVF